MSEILRPGVVAEWDEEDPSQNGKPAVESGGAAMGRYQIHQSDGNAKELYRAAEQTPRG